MGGKALFHIALVAIVAVIIVIGVVAALIALGVQPAAAAPLAGGIVTALTAAFTLRKELLAALTGRLTTPFIHHVSLPVRDLERSTAFYVNEIGLSRIPPKDISFGVEVAWFQLPGGQQLHLLVSPDATYRNPATAREKVWNDCHFAIRVETLSEVSRRLEKHNRETYVHPKVNADRYPHFYVLDPDDHVIEINITPPEDRKK